MVCAFSGRRRSPCSATCPPRARRTAAQLAECAGFADGFTWGTVRTADVKIGTEVAASVPVQIIGDLSASSAPTGDSGCPSGNEESSTSDLGANGILGIGTQTYDCGNGCVNSAQNAMYFSCNNGANCTGTTVPLAQQVTNPVTKFAVNNNGVIVQLPPVSDNGSPSATVVLIFGIGTQSNNGLSGVTKYGTDPFGDLTGTYKGNTYSTFFDTGSNGNFFQDNFPLCSSFQRVLLREFGTVAIGDDDPLHRRQHRDGSVPARQRAHAHAGRHEVRLQQPRRSAGHARHVRFRPAVLLRAARVCRIPSAEQPGLRGVLMDR